MAFSRLSPGCCGCGSTVNTCFQVFGCCQQLAGATVDVYECSDPGTILETGTTNSFGVWCVDLTAYSALDLCATVTYPDDYDVESFSLGSPVSSQYQVNLSPATEGGTAGTLTVTLVDEDGFPVTSGTAYVVDPANPLSFVASATMGAGGIVTFTGLTVPFTYFFRGPNLQNFPEFELTCEGTADAKYAYLGEGQEWTFTSISCDGGGRVCCDTCFPDTIPDTLCLDDPRGTWVGADAGAYGYAAVCEAQEYAAQIDHATCLTSALCYLWAVGKPPSACGSETAAWTHEPTGGGLNVDGTIYVARATYAMWCDIESDTMKLAVFHSPACFFECCEYTFPTTNCTTCDTTLRTGGAAPLYDGVSAIVEATSVTCDPFSATFDIPELSFDWQPCPRPCTSSNGSGSIPARTITVTEGPCP